MRTEELKQILIVSLMAIAVCAPSLFWITMPGRDSSLYALLTIELSQGNFTRAFNADYAPMLTVLGGTINYFLDSPFRANQIASILLFLPGIPGTYMLARELRGPKIAFIAALLYAVCPYTIEPATSGGLDAGKLGLMPWLAWATYKWCGSDGLRWGIAVGFIGGALSYARGEGIIFVVLSLMIFMGLSVWKKLKRREASLKIPLVSLLAAASVLTIVILPWIAYETSQTGYVVTHTSQIKLYELLDGLQRAIFSDANASSLDTDKKDSETPGYTRTEKHSEDIPWFKNIEKSLKGLYLPYLLLAFIGIFHQWRSDRTLVRNDFFPVIFIVLNFAIFFPTTVCNSRYFQPTIPLYLHLAALGAVAVGTILGGYRVLTKARIKLLAFTALFILAILAQKECEPFKSHEKLREDRMLVKVGRWINENRESYPFYGTLPNLREYHNGRMPVILSADYRICYYAGADCVVTPRDIELTPADIADFCRHNKIALILYDSRIEEFCPGFGEYWPLEPSYRAVDLADDFPADKHTLRLLVFDESGKRVPVRGSGN
ncbi:MAG: glycosyltransferase family 39 protein [Desulforhabdus sp.]|jgi:hypothetical protein|nr:glycosyltransferase family 39 protein [Desulforhabdus sp.]